ncbi:3-methyladenine DNA glycosylase [Tessaracoccus sp. ZS01]|nr:3-methyladenine DNA glycosylase [Tessaracoccus sp. MC1756]MCG6566645.1 3-methyladenine DNA glycosylase [Tessaracoccus sp. ZS01]OMG59066.1 3-methyladenine DNA glycosylase [Tessaracoccus sp. ZS01]
MASATQGPERSSVRVLEAAEWRERAEIHRGRVTAELAEVVRRRERGLKHPVDDFLFQYYNLRPSHLAQWHPGAGVGLAGGEAFAERQFYATTGRVTVLDAASFLAKRGGTVETAHRLLAAAADKAPRFGCFGMHEWAMVYRLQEGQTRHPYLKLRFDPAEVARIVEEVGCRCTHFDAFRFFTEPARPLNVLQPTRETQPDLDQPGCLHVNMDLYRWAGKLSPAVGSELLFEAYLLARDIREVDMQASAYDLADWGYEPIAVETAEGRARYAAVQRGFAERAVPLRHEILRVIRSLES